MLYLAETIMTMSENDFHVETNIRMNELFGLLIIILIAAVILYIFEHGGKKKPDPSQDQKDALAIEMLKGTSAEELSKREGIPAEEIKKWKDEFLNDALDFARNKNEYKAKRAEADHEIEWFMQACAKYIGEDWKKITGYDKRNR